MQNQAVGLAIGVLALVTNAKGDFLGDFMVCWANDPDPGISFAMNIRFYDSPPGPPCPWDFDNDGIVGISDLLTLLGDWGTDFCGRSDIDGNGVTVSDLLLMLAHWGDCPQ